MVSSEDLVPGDVIQVRGGGWVLPADMLLLNGGAVVNESSLTGESMTVSKSLEAVELDDLDPEAR